MKKFLLPIVVLSTFVACKKETTVKDAKLEALIKNKDVEGLQKYKERQKFKLDSINQVMANIDTKLTSLGATPTANGVVSLQKLELTNFVQHFDIQGSVTTDQDVMVQPNFSGLLSLYVKKGQNVSKGQVIGRVADGGLNDQHKQALIQVSAANAQLQQIKANANLAKIAYEKQEALWKQKIGSEFQYLQAKTNYEAIQSQIAAAQNQVSATQKAADAIKANLAKTAIVAPFSGVIDEVVTQNGQVVSPGSNIVKLISLGMMRIEANVPENYLAKIRVGTPVKVFLPTINQKITSKIRLVGNYIDPATRTFKIEIPVSSYGGIVKPNLLAQVSIESYVNPSAIQIPQNYVYDDAAYKSYVFVATNINGNNAVAKKVYVNLGEKSSNMVEVTSGLNGGDQLITDGSKNLTNGQKVKLAQ
ncbi:efflux RND transporter periplasmic adaptor subunit [Chryseobacterium koreense]|uniref:efflux RND transporter periplasmic adaptor subunit n=1 Tax=Chryseobacterium koreense TaxID=232216 RepID=UPI00065B0133|nr:efflux RND transporter periplasmic adaptor subunit [Chryseobacterium koreense]MBB5333768.1 RND family efflux transporter MFP subunit [Chryseobacterium koreense]